MATGLLLVDGLLRFGRQKYGIPGASIEEVTDRLAADKVFDLPPAGRLGIPIGTVKSRLAKAYQHLGAQLAHVVEESDAV